MKTQVTKQHNDVMAIQQPTTLHKEDRMKKHSSTTLKLAMLVAMVITMALSANAQIVYMVTQDNLPPGTSPASDTNHLVSVDLGAPLVSGKFKTTFIGLTVQPSASTAEIRGLAFDPNNNTVYGITAQGVFVSVDISTGKTSRPLLTVTRPGGPTQNEWSGLAFDGTSNFYAVNAYGNNELEEINFSGSTYTATLKGSTTYNQIPQQILGLAWSNGTLYGTDRGTDNIVTINPNNGSVSFLFPYTTGVNNLQEIGFGPSGKLYAAFDHVSSSDDAGLATYNFNNGTATELGEFPFQIDFNGCQGCGNSTYGAGGFAFAPVCMAPPGSMVAWYSFDQSGSSQNDLTSYNNTATAYGNYTSIPGEVSNALQFDGTSAYVQASDQSQLDMGTGDFSIDAWVKLSATTGGVVSLVDKRQNSPLQGYQFYLYNGRLGFQLANGGNYTNYVSTTAVPPDGNWHLVAVTVHRATNGGTWYLDGSPAGTFDSSTQPGSVSTPGTPLVIGTQEAGIGVGEFFNGGIDELEIFSRVLKATEVLALYQAGSAGKCK